MLQEAREIKISSRLICAKFAKEYKKKIIQFSKGNDRDENWNRHKIIVETKENKKIKFIFYNSVKHDAEMIFRPEYDGIPLEELTLIIKLLELWEQE